MRRGSFILLLSGAAAWTGFAGCDKNGPDFFAVECKNPPDAVLMPTGVESDDYRGLTCVSYSCSGGELELDLINIWGNCTGIDGFVEDVSDDAVELLVRPPDCDNMARCSCPFDLSLSVGGVGSGDVTLTIGDYSCSKKEAACAHIAVLPLGEEPAGMACRYASDGDSGALHDLCSLEPDGLTCGEGLTCAAMETGGYAEARCLAQCGTDADCPAPGALACAADGLCRVIADLDWVCAG